MHFKMPEEVICCPETYYCDIMRNFICENRSDTNQQWIFDLIQKRYRPSEIVLLRTPEWTLCRDAQIIQSKWLIVFHDTELHSIRDLRARHIQMLLDSQMKCRRELRRRKILDDNHEAVFFFHYFPSVYQLHMHVHVHESAVSEVSRPHIRRHLVQQVVRNLLSDGDFYTKALILTSVPKALKHTGIFTCLFENADGTLCQTSTTSESFTTNKCRNMHRHQKTVDDISLRCSTTITYTCNADIVLDPDSRPGRRTRFSVRKNKSQCKDH